MGNFGVLEVGRGRACGEFKGRKRWGTRTWVLKEGGRCLSVAVLEGFRWGSLSVRRVHRAAR